MTIEEYLATKPTREEVIKTICSIANNNVLRVDDTYAWEDLSKYAGVTVDDFWDDEKGTIERFEDERAIAHFGIYNWKLKENN